MCREKKKKKEEKRQRMGFSFWRGIKSISFVIGISISAGCKMESSNFCRTRYRDGRFARYSAFILPLFLFHCKPLSFIPFFRFFFFFCSKHLFLGRSLFSHHSFVFSFRSFTRCFFFSNFIAKNNNKNFFQVEIISSTYGTIIFSKS